MSNLNKEQWFTVLRAILMSLGGGLVAKGTLSKDQLASTVDAVISAIGALMLVAPLIWSLISKTDKNQVAAVGAIQGVKVLVDTTASDGAKAAALDDNVKGVNPTPALKDQAT